MIIIGASVVYICPDLCTYVTAQTGSLGQISSAQRSTWIFELGLEPLLMSFIQGPSFLFQKRVSRMSHVIRTAFYFGFRTNSLFSKSKLKSYFTVSCEFALVEYPELKSILNTCNSSLTVFSGITRIPL